jgi:hypothetical protein
MASQVPRALGAARSTASSLGLPVDDAVVLQNSNRLTLRLLPCDVLARVTPAADQIAQLEIDLALQLTAVGSPVAALDPRVEPRVHERDSFVITLWTYYPPGRSRQVPPADYAAALGRLHADLRTLDVRTPHFTDRVDSARQLVDDHDRSPELTEPDRALLGETLGDLGRAVAEHGADQLLHGEPHPGNVLPTAHGPLFIDFETCCRGPVEFDIAHAPDDVGERCPGVDPERLQDCRLLVRAMVTAWRWDRTDQFPGGRRLAREWLSQFRADLDRHGRTGRAHP